MSVCLSVCLSVRLSVHVCLVYYGCGVFIMSMYTCVCVYICVYVCIHTRGINVFYTCITRVHTYTHTRLHTCSAGRNKDGVVSVHELRHAVAMMATAGFSFKYLSLSMEEVHRLIKKVYHVCLFARIYDVIRANIWGYTREYMRS
jgi:hypothetical protein